MSVTTGDVAAGPTSGRRSGRVIDGLHRPALRSCNPDAKAPLLCTECCAEHAPQRLRQRNFLLFSARVSTDSAALARPYAHWSFIPRRLTAGAAVCLGMSRNGAALRA